MSLASKVLMLSSASLLHELALGRFRARRIASLKGMNEGHYVMNLLRTHHRTPRGHALIGHAIRDRRRDLGQLAAMDPVIVGEVRANQALALRPVTGGAATLKVLTPLLHLAGNFHKSEKTLLADLGFGRRGHG